MNRETLTKASGLLNAETALLNARDYLQEEDTKIEIYASMSKHITLCGKCYREDLIASIDKRLKEINKEIEEL